MGIFVYKIRFKQLCGVGMLVIRALNKSCFVKKFAKQFTCYRKLKGLIGRISNFTNCFPLRGSTKEIRFRNKNSNLKNHVYVDFKIFS